MQTTSKSGKGENFTLNVARGGLLRHPKTCHPSIARLRRVLGGPRKKLEAEVREGGSLEVKMKKRKG